MIKKVVFMGTPDFAVPCLQILAAEGYEIQAVFTQPDKPRGRSGKPAPCPVKEEALKLGLPVYQPAKIREEENVKLLSELKPDAIIVTAFGQIIPPSILEIPPYGCINVHASLLPAWRGAAPIQWTVINGDPTGGVTTMLMGEGLDTGDILLKTEISIAPDETGGSLFHKLSTLGAELLAKTLTGLAAGEITPEKQPEISPTPYARMLKKQMGCIDWNQDAASIERLIRGLAPWPSAYTYLNGKQLKLWQAQVAAPKAEAEAGLQPGTVTEVAGDSFTVQTGEGCLKILQLQLEGKKSMSTEAFLRGYCVEAGTVLGEKLG